MTVSGTGDNVVIGVGSADTSTGGSMTLIGVSSSNAYSSVVSLTAELSSAMDGGSVLIRCDSSTVDNGGALTLSSVSGIVTGGSVPLIGGNGSSGTGCSITITSGTVPSTIESESMTMKEADSGTSDMRVEQWLYYR